MSAKKLTRTGALNATRILDQAAELIQRNATVFGIPEAVALDFAKRADILSDTIETTAAKNFPRTAGDEEDDEKEEKDADEGKTAAGHAQYEDYVRDWKALKYPVDVKGKMLSKERWEELMGKADGGKTAAADWAQPAKNETGLSLPLANGGWDANAIGDDRGGPYESQPDESSYMSGHFAQNWFHQLCDKVESNTVPRLGQVDKFAAAGMAMSACLRDVVRVASYGPMAAADLQDHIQQVGEIHRVATDLQAEVTAAADDFTRQAGTLDNDQLLLVASFHNLAEALQTQSGQIADIGDTIANGGRLAADGPDAARFSVHASESIADLWDAVQKQAAGFQRVVSRLKGAGIEKFSHVPAALGRLFDMGSASVTNSQARVAHAFGELEASHGDKDRSTLRRLLAEEGMNTRLAGDDDEDDKDDEGKTAGINLFE